jgi:hypothetical protein
MIQMRGGPSILGGQTSPNWESSTNLRSPTVLGPHLSIVVLPLMLLINSRSNFRACNMTLSGN